MSTNWTETQQKTTNYTVSGGYLEYYVMATNLLNGYAGRLAPGATVTVEYDANKDAMKITASSNSFAVGKYILKPRNESGTFVLLVSNSKTTTEATTTTDTTTGTTTPLNTSSDGTTSSSTVDADPVYIDDAFIDNVYYVNTVTAEQYANNLESGLRVQSLRAVLGMPHQFLPITDPRLDSTTTPGGYSGFGRVYSEKIIKNIPLLLMTPGVPSFMASYNSEQKNTVLKKLDGILDEVSLDSVFNDGRIGKYYSLKYAYTEYFYYVNAMLRSAAYFLGIQNKEIDGTQLGELNWLYTTSAYGSEIYSKSNLGAFLGPYAGCIAFYADCGTTVDDSFGNSTTESQLASTLNNLSDTGREINFLVGNVGGMAGLSLSELTGAGDVEGAVQEVERIVSPLLGSNNVLNNILGKATTILAGGRVIFPEIWSDSSFSRSYSCSMKLVSPSGDRLSVFLNILVPIYHILAFTLPREATNQAYFSPFLVRAYYKGLFNVDMGIIPGLSITKGEEGEWSVYGIPTVANISFEIKDLYDGMYMSKQNALDYKYSILSNIQELDYIANSCGINVNDQEVNRTIAMATALFTTDITDKITIGIGAKMAEYFNQKIQNIFGVF